MSRSPHRLGVSGTAWLAFAIAAVSGFTFLEVLALIQRHRLGYPLERSLTLSAWARRGLGVDPLLPRRSPVRGAFLLFLAWLAVHILRP